LRLTVGTQTTAQDIEFTVQTCTRIVKQLAVSREAVGV
jgi:cysteine sulfinate desulfinase/cysteine desulfurase-like protein